MRKNYLSRSKLIVTVVLAAFAAGSTVCAQDNPEMVSKHYVLPEFVKGSVLMKNGKTQEEVMNYNMITEEMIYEKDNSRWAINNLERIDTIYIGSMKFIPHDKIFYEVLVNGKISLYEKHKCNLLQSGSPAGYGETSETSAATSISVLSGTGALYKLQLPKDYHIKDASQFWISNEKTESIVTSQKQFLKIFPDKSRELEQFIKQNKLNVKKQDDLIVLIKKCNELSR
jgi:hypothetical protein